MPPIRRYLRISKYSVLECRIFLENPADGPRWLLSLQDPALPRVFEAIQPLVLPKLREENERARGKGKKKKAVKDVVTRGPSRVKMTILLKLTQVHLQMTSKFPSSLPRSGPGTRYWRRARHSNTKATSPALHKDYLEAIPIPSSSKRRATMMPRR